MTKERLRQYSAIVKEIEELKERIAIIEAKCSARAIIITDMPKGGIPPDNLTKLGDAVRELAILESNLHCEMIAIEEYINSLPDGRVRAIFRYKHFHNYTFEKIGNKLNYSTRHVKRLYYIHYNKLSEK